MLADHHQGGLALDHDHPDHRVTLAQIHALHAGGVTPHGARVLLVESYAESVPRGDDDVIRAASHLHVDELIAVLDLDALHARDADIGVFRQRRLLDRPVLGAEEQEFVVRKLLHRHHRLDHRVRRDVDQVNDWLALGGAAGLRNLVHLEPEAASILCEAEDVVVRLRDEEVLDEVLSLKLGADDPLAAVALLAIRRD